MLVQQRMITLMLCTSVQTPKKYGIKKFVMAGLKLIQMKSYSNHYLYLLVYMKVWKYLLIL